MPWSDCLIVFPDPYSEPCQNRINPSATRPIGLRAPLGRVESRCAMRLRKGIVALILLLILVNLTACISFESDVFVRRAPLTPTAPPETALVAQTTDHGIIQP